MPYEWNTTSDPDAGTPRETLHLWPHQSLQPRGYVGFISATALLLCLPLMAVMGSLVLWGLLPFLVLALGGIIFALDKNRKDNQILETLELGPEDALLTRSTARGARQSWSCNRYWTRVELRDNGPVPNYVTLTGNGREVEIGAFLSEDERKDLYHELVRTIRAPSG